LDAGGLGEVLQRWVLAVQHVDVIRPVREVDRVVELLFGPPRGRAGAAARLGVVVGNRRALHAAGGEERPHAERADTGARGPQHVAAGYSSLRQAAPHRRVDIVARVLWLRAVLIVHRSLPRRPRRSCWSCAASALANWIGMLW